MDARSSGSEDPFAPIMSEDSGPAVAWVDGERFVNVRNLGLALDLSDQGVRNYVNRGELTPLTSQEVPAALPADHVWFSYAAARRELFAARRMSPEQYAAWPE